MTGTTKGDWYLGNTLERDSIRNDAGWPIAETLWPDMNADAERTANAEHIVRLHNRQPKYDALVDAAATHRSIHDAADGFCGICDALAALEQESQP